MRNLVLVFLWAGLAFWATASGFFAYSVPSLGVPLLAWCCLLAALLLRADIRRWVWSADRRTAREAVAKLAVVQYGTPSDKNSWVRDKFLAGEAGGGPATVCTPGYEVSTWDSLTNKVNKAREGGA